MSGLSIKLPIALDEQDGFALNKTIKDIAQQNLKNVIFTSKGERPMDLNFGVGLKKFLFENKTNNLYNEISSEIHSQVNKYLPYLEITNISFFDSNSISDMDQNSVNIKIYYNILPIAASDILSLVEKIN